MACEIVTAHGRTVIACGGRQPRRCETSGCTGTAVALCDFRLGYEKSCDRRMCETCRTRVGGGLDHCPEHREERASL